jgi:peroxiredoxin
VQKQYEAIRQAGAEVLVVTFSRLDVLAMYLRDKHWPFPVVSDVDLTAYKAFNMGRATWGAIFSTNALAYYGRLILRGWVPKLPYAKEDPLQLGGDFVLNADRRLVYSHPSRDPSDRPSPEQLIEAVHKAAAEVRGAV